MPTERVPRARSRQARAASVVRVTWLTPRMVRVVLAGAGLAEFPVGDFTDHYVKLLFPPPGADYTHPFDVDTVQAEREPEQWPVTRTYTVRDWDVVAGELTIDFVYHGEEGIAGPWAAQAGPGDPISFFGPGGAYAPDPAADWYLFAGDESALPAIAASLERVPAGAVALAFIEVENAAEEQGLESPGDLHVTWLHRDGRHSNGASGLVNAVTAAQFPGGVAQAFVHGDAGFVKDLRHHLRFERSLPRAALSASGYWRRGRTEEGWRAEKAEWKRVVDEDEQAHSSDSTDRATPA